MAFASMSTGISPGFEDPVHGAQKVFSSVMHAMARPGRVAVFDNMPKAPDPLFDTTAALLLTLADYDTQVWFDPGLVGSSEAMNWVAFHTGAPQTNKREEAAFAVSRDVSVLEQLHTFAQGTAEYPDRSATLILQVEALNDETDWQLTGPGIENVHTLGVMPEMQTMVHAWNRNRSQFPLGVDLILCARKKTVCLPRTVKIEEVA